MGSRTYMSKRMVLMLGITGLVLGLIFGLKAFGNRMMHQAFDNMPLPPATISATEARAETWTDVIEAVGTLAAVQGTELSTEQGGIVGSIEFESGQQVKKGDRKSVV